MMHSKLSVLRRSERLEEHITPEIVTRVWQIIIVDSDGSGREGEKIEWLAPIARGRVPAFRKRR